MEYVDGTLSLKRKLVWDSVPCSRVTEMMPKMGVVPGSPEVEDMEHAESHRRLSQLAPINHMLMMTSALAGEVVGRAILENQGIEFSEEDVAKYSGVAFVVASSVIANLVDMGFLHVTAGGIIPRGILG